MRSRIVKNDKINRKSKNSITQNYNNQIDNKNDNDSKNDNNYDNDRK